MERGAYVTKTLLERTYIGDLRGPTHQNHKTRMETLFAILLCRAALVLNLILGPIPNVHIADIHIRIVEKSFNCQI